jgi:hypothetical protein
MTITLEQRPQDAKAALVSVGAIAPKARGGGIAGSVFGSGVVKQPFDRLIDDSVSRNLQQSLRLQVVDLIAYAADRTARKETERFKAFSFDALVKRDKAHLDIFWLKDESLEESANLPPPDVIATEIAEDLAAALDQFAEIASSLSPNS